MVKPNGGHIFVVRVVDPFISDLDPDPRIPFHA